MKFALIGAAVATLALTLPAAADHLSGTPAVGTKTTSAAAGYVSPNGMVNGSTSLANGERAHHPYAYRFSRSAELDRYALNDPAYRSDREENVVIIDD